MGENTSQIEREIVEKRSDLGRNLVELEGKARDLADWRVHHRNHPGLFMGLAFGAGLVLGLATPPARRSDVDDRFDRDTSHDPLRSMSAMGSSGYGTRALAKRQIGETWEQIAEALLGVASAKVVGFVSELVPGFRDQFDRPTSGARPYPRDSHRESALNA